LSNKFLSFGSVRPHAKSKGQKTESDVRFDYSQWRSSKSGEWFAGRTPIHANLR
jgi:hypothetical protein